MSENLEISQKMEIGENNSDIDVAQTQPLVFTSAALKYAGKGGKELENSNKYIKIGEKYHLCFKMIRCSQTLIRIILHSYGFQQCSSRNTNCNIIWTSSHLKPHILRSLAPWQRVNHFPRSFLLTRKDKLYECLRRAQILFGISYNIIPEFFVTPKEYKKLEDHFNAQTHGLKPFIVKPVASSRGNGIFIAQSPRDIPLGSTMLVSRYIETPYLLNGYKFDLRLYVLVTSFYPLVAYMYSEGLTRFASEKYCSMAKSYEQHFSHLTNYSLNKNNGKFIKNESADAEDEGHKWTLGALLRKLQSSGIDTNLLMVRVEDVILKALFSVQGQIAAACKNVVPYSKCCFELFGFDVLIDASLKPWLLEVNLSPSLTCDSPLDLQLKSSLVCDVLTLAAIPLNARKFAENQHTKTGLMSGALKRMRYRSKERSMFITQRLKKKSLRCLSPSLSPSKFRKNSRECVRKSLEQWKMESNRLGAFLPLFPRGNSFLVYRCIMEEYDIINWDACLFEGIHGDKFSQDLDKETVKLVHQELMDCENITNTSALSNSVLQVLMPSLKMAEKYLSRMTTPGVKYAKKLPKLRPELCKRSGSFEESKRKARLVSNDDDIIFTTTSQIDRANFDRIPLDEKPSSKVPLTELSQTTDVKASAGQSEVEKKISEGSDPNENAEPILPMQNY